MRGSAWTSKSPAVPLGALISAERGNFAGRLIVPWNAKLGDHTFTARARGLREIGCPYQEAGMLGSQTVPGFSAVQLRGGWLVLVAGCLLPRAELDGPQRDMTLGRVMGAAGSGGATTATTPAANADSSSLPGEPASPGASENTPVLPLSGASAGAGGGGISPLSEPDAGIVSDATAPQMSSCPDGVLNAEQTSCYVVVLELLPWAEARQACQGLGGELASVESPAEEAFLEQQLAESFWLGANDAALEGEYTWGDGSPLEFENWGPGQPDFFGAGCIEKRGGDGLWYDGPCDVPLAFVCELVP